MKEKRQLWLLMWKHVQLRKYRWFLTIVEILLPIILGYAFCSQATKFMGKSSPEPAWIEPVRSNSEIMRNAFRHHLLYAPKNAFTEQLVERTKNFINFVSVEDFPDEQELMKYLVNKTSISYGESSFKRDSGTWIGIIFSDTNNETKPARVTYKMRDANQWYTQILFPDSLPPGPSHGDPYLNQGFAGLQMAFDTAIIQQWDPNFSLGDIYFQPFPYPEYEKITGYRNELAQSIFFIVIVTTFLLSFPLISHIIEEKESGVKELMKLVGVSEWLIQFSWFLNGIMFSLFSFTIVTYLLQYKFENPDAPDPSATGVALLTTVPVSLVWICIMLYCVSNIAFCFTFSALFHSTTVATSVFTMVYIALGYGASYISSLNSAFLIRLICLFPVVAIRQGFRRIGFFENHKINVTWSALNEAEDESKGVSLLFVYLILIFDTILYFFLTYYISSINPGTFGSKKSPLFFLKKFWPSSHANEAQELIDMDDEKDSKYFEDPPKSLEVSIQIRDLYKKFGSFVAVKGLNLKVFKGEITALLGHNGAGKTTTMSILTGMLKPNAGSITYDQRLDVLNEMSEFRQNLGMCPQEDRLFPYLTVADHLWFFGMLKGGTKSDVEKEADSYLRLMEMSDKKNAVSRSLSGGMKRKLCLAISLMGNSQILILDEPTSGMDVESRRKIWDLLLELRGTRTIILSTHYMEEADVLGDRIAIMDSGNVVCHGTTMYLKKAYDTGYKLTIMKEPGDFRLTNVVTKSVPNAQQESESDTEIVFNLPLTESAKFSALFKILETEKTALGIQNMGVTCTTMEQVFLKVGGASIYDVGKKRSSTVTDGNLLSEHSKDKKTGLSLLFLQLGALLWKKALFTERNIIQFCYRVLIYSVFIVFLLYSSDTINKEEPPISLSLSLYPNAKIMLTGEGGLHNEFKNYVENQGETIISTNNKYINDEDSSDVIKKEESPLSMSLSLYPNEKIMLTGEGDLYDDFENYDEYGGDTIISSNYTSKSIIIIDELLNYGRSSLNSFQRELLLAASFNSSMNLTLYNKFGYHSLPVLINTISNIQLGLIAGKDKSIETINSPIHQSERECKVGVTSIASIILWFIALVFFTIDLTYFYATFLSIERIDGFKHIQLMSNVSLLIYWFSNWIFDFLFFLSIVVLRIIAIKIFADSDGFLAFTYPYYVFLLLLCGYLASGLLFSYVLNFISGSREGSYLLLFLFSMIGVIVAVVFYIVEFALASTSGSPNDLTGSFSVWTVVFYVVKYLTLLLPPMNYSVAFIKYAWIWYDNAALKNPACGGGAENNGKEFLVFASRQNPNGLLLEVYFMMVNIVLYSLLLAAIEAGYVSRLFNKFVVRNYGHVLRESTAEPVDPDVELERRKVEMQTQQLAENVSVEIRKRHSDVEKNLDSDSYALETVPLNRASTRNSVVIAQGLKKVFLSKTLKPFVAVEDVNFVVNTGECFGLLGVNGAGKSTTFKMLTAIELPTKGDSYIHNIRLSQNKTMYLSKAGYCAQTNCFIEELTGREMLQLIASLRGVRSDNRKLIVDKWLSILGLESYQNRRCGRYSGGNKRKLCTAMSLIGDPSVVFLDEPTTGVDPVSRRKLYDVMDHSKLSGQAVVLTSHSMEECENLCDRLTIMSKGRMKCIGTTQHLKQRYAQGFSILIKTRDVPADEERSLLDALKYNIEATFGKNFSILKDEHKGLLYYQITNVQLKWSELFENLENIKLKNDAIMEDYTVSDTTLEEVFISFAKQE